MSQERLPKSCWGHWEKQKKPMRGLWDAKPELYEKYNTSSSFQFVLWVQLECFSEEKRMANSPSFERWPKNKGPIHFPGGVTCGCWLYCSTETGSVHESMSDTSDPQTSPSVTSLHLLLTNMGLNNRFNWRKENTDHFIGFRHSLKPHRL